MAASRSARRSSPGANHSIGCTKGGLPCGIQAGAGTAHALIQDVRHGLGFPNQGLYWLSPVPSGYDSWANSSSWRCFAGVIGANFWKGFERVSDGHCWAPLFGTLGLNLLLKHIRTLSTFARGGPRGHLCRVTFWATSAVDYTTIPPDSPWRHVTTSTLHANAWLHL